LNVVQQLCWLIDAMLPPLDSNPPPPEDADSLEKFFMFCLTWSLGGALVAEDREHFSDFVYNLSSTMRAPGTLYDVYLEFKTQQLKKWDDLVPEYKAPAEGKFSQILVPTVDTIRYSWI
jgi:dynein heavy chain